MWLTHELFARRIGEQFALVTETETLHLVLAETWVSREGGGLGPEGQNRQQFSLIFDGPRGAGVPQGTYRLAHDELGDLELFLVPVGVHEGHLRYEAAFA